MKTLVLVGAGHAHVVALYHWFASPLKDIQIILISNVEYAPYSGMLPGYLAGFYQQHEIVFDVRALADHYKIRLIIAEVSSIEEKINQLKLTTGETINYDCLSINIGILPERINPEDYASVIYVKPLSQFIPKWMEFTSGRKVDQVVVVGSGPAGFELAQAIRLKTKAQICLISEAPDVLMDVPASVRKKARKILQQNHITLRTNSHVESIRPGELTLADGNKLPFDFAFVATRAKPYPWLGQLNTDKFLRVLNQSNIYAAGDCISFDDNPLPKAGVYAVRQGPILCHNLQSHFTQSAPKAFEPQKHYLKILITGPRTALAIRSRWYLSGKLAWKWKDMIDRKFMKTYGARP